MRKKNESYFLNRLSRLYVIAKIQRRQERDSSRNCITVTKRDCFSYEKKCCGQNNFKIRSHCVFWKKKSYIILFVFGLLSAFEVNFNGTIGDTYKRVLIKISVQNSQCGTDVYILLLIFLYIAATDSKVKTDHRKKLIDSNLSNRLITQPRSRPRQSKFASIW